MKKIYIILIIAILIRLVFFTGFNASDDYILTNAADQLNKGTINFNQIDNHIPFRLTLLLSTAFLTNLFGINNFSITLIPLICSLGIVLLTYLISKKLFNKKIALIASFLISIFPLEVLHSSILVAETIGGFFMLLGIYLFLQDKKQFYLLSGICLGIAHLSKITFCFVLPILLIYLLIIKKKITLEHILLGAGFILMLVPEFLFFYIKSGNPLIRYQVAKTFASHIVPKTSNLLKEVLFKYLKITLNPINFQAGLFFYLFYTCTIIAIIKKIKKLYPLLIFTFFFILYLNFSSSSLIPYSPLPRSIRYLMVVSAPFCIISAYVINSIKPNLKKIILPLTLIILTISSLGYLYFASNTMYESATVNSIESIPHILNTNKTIYIDDLSYLSANYLTQFNKNNLYTFKELNNLSQLKNSYTILNHQELHKGISFGNTTQKELIIYLQQNGKIIQNISRYQKPICTQLSQLKILKNQINQGCKKTDLIVYQMN